ncbi:PRC-barrel domain-containing protein [Gimesia panareensis]|nr:PRC-barrel domain-containing protein [Gimesia panareensis]
MTPETLKKQRESNMELNASRAPDQDSTKIGTRSAFRLEVESGKETDMFRSTNELSGYHILATDGECGSIKDFLFDDESSIVRYLIVNTGGWLTGRKVLISPVAIDQPNLDTRELPTVLSRENIETSPAIEEDLPVSRQIETELSTHYNWPVYWGASGTSLDRQTSATQVAELEGNPHLRSINEVIGYQIQCMEGTLGHIDDLIVDTESWSMRYVVIDTRNWFPGKKVIIAFDWITHFTWGDRRAHVDLTREQIKNAPVYDPHLPVNRAYELQLYDFYGRPTYW